MCVFKKIGKINVSNTVSKTTKGTEFWQGIPHADNSFSKKPVASTFVAMWFKQFVSMSSGLVNMTKFKNIGEVDGHHAENNLVTEY